jgi:hypothetical protein
LVVDDQKVWRLQLAVHQVFTVKKSQGVEGRKQHFPDFVGGKGPVGKNLRESLLRIFHHNEEKWVPPELATTRVEKANQMRMGESGNRPPARELYLCLHRVSRDELNRRIRRALCPGKEYYAVV